MFIFPAVPEDTVSLYTASGSYSLSSAKIPQPWKEGHDVDFHLGMCVLHFFIIWNSGSCASLGKSISTTNRSFIVRVERFSNLGV